MNLFLDLLFVRDQILWILIVSYLRYSENIFRNLVLLYNFLKFFLHVFNRVNLLWKTISKIKANLEILILIISFLNFFLLILVTLF